MGETIGLAVRASSRRLPGEGDLPLRAFLAALPQDARVGLEIPMLARVGAEGGLEALVARAVVLSRDLLTNHLTYRETHDETRNV